MKSTVTSIEKGTGGNPGEKLARFASERKVIGDINRNSPFGIFGTLHESIKNRIADKAIPIAFSDEVKEGPAQILTVIENDKVEKFDIQVVSTTPQKFPATKGMVLKITDPRLLSKTGGIVQGMSGSPIIQNGKIIGAVTHVSSMIRRADTACILNGCCLKRESIFIKKKKQADCRIPPAVLISSFFLRIVR